MTILIDPLPIRAVLALAFLVCGFANAVEGPPPPSFKDVVRVEFHSAHGGEKEPRVVIDDAKELKELIKAVKLAPKQPCLCEHLWAVTFVTDKESIEAEICDHCFDVKGEKGKTYYHMPPKFYKLFLKYKQRERK